MTKSFDIDQIVQDLLTEMPLKEKAAIANIDEDKVPLLQYAFDVYLNNGLGMDDETSKDVMHRIWEVLGDASGSVCEIGRTGLDRACPKEEVDEKHLIYLWHHTEPLSFSWAPIY
jgi:hypothetical protein